MTRRFSSRQIVTSGAHHEAAHAVVAVLLGGWLNDDGVQVAGVNERGTRDYAGFSFRPQDYSRRTRILVNMVGFLAELKLLDLRERRRSDDDLLDVIEAVASGDPDGLEHEEGQASDDADMFEALLSDKVERSPQRLIQIYRSYERAAERLLARPEVWAAVRGVAGLLLERGKLSSEEVVEVVEEVVPYFETSRTRLARYRAGRRLGDD